MTGGKEMQLSDAIIAYLGLFSIVYIIMLMAYKF